MASTNMEAEVSNDEQFTTSVPQKELSCHGHPCAKCGKCRDWCYTGDLNSWNWIRNYKNWKLKDAKIWENEFIWKRFKLRSGATCFMNHGYWDCRSDWDLDGSRNTIAGHVVGFIQKLIDAPRGWASGDFATSLHSDDGDGGFSCLCEDNRHESVEGNWIPEYFKGN